ncbi:MAG: methyltransferase domain-containing protein, partial [Anaerolineaceae bacterium]|nr:methyltransferase domain-containing protein [Anaerolineaceae bacterium]
SEALTSPDLNLSQIPVNLNDHGIQFPSGEEVSWSDISRISTNLNAVYFLENDTINKVQEFSPRSNRYYSLMPTQSAPTMLISGIPMHRIKDTNPWKDTVEKINAFGGINGKLLDINTGLGYTAIQASKKASEVVTIEIEPTVLALCRQNPWSRPLFGSRNIQTILGDSYDIVSGFPDNSFERVLHDPPTFALAGDLYSQYFYEQLFRVLTPNGKLFHYIGNPNSKTGASVTRGVISRLQAVGFKHLTPRPDAFGLLALK